jgi:lipid II:glycine glycyltransferase (peptidoglycan interpeptide bridge formation enzyme)
MAVRQVADQEIWNSFVKGAPSFSLLQSWEWGEFKQKMGWQVYRVGVEESGMIKAGAQMLIKSLPLGMASIAYVPRGPLCDWEDHSSTGMLLAEMHRIARKHKAIYLKIEPPLRNTPQNDQAVQRYSFIPSRIHNQPRNTIIIDLDRDLETILSEMHHKTRYHIRRAERKGVKVSVGGSEDLPGFIDLIQHTGRRKRFSTRKREYYELEWKIFSDRDQCVLLMASHENRLIAVHLAVLFGSHAAYFHGGSLDLANNISPNYLLMWEAIQWAKGKGCATFDLWGIPDEIEGSVDKDQDSFLERKDGLWGVYRFKSGFSKNVVSYLGAYDYIYHPIPYALFDGLISSRDVAETVAVWAESRK